MAKPKIADVATNEGAPEKGAFVPKVVRKVTMPTIKVAAGDTVWIKFLDAIQTKQKQEKNEKTGAMEEKTIDVAHIVMLDSGEEGQIVVGDVLKKNLDENYPDAGYVGKGFQIEKKQVPGKRYMNYLIDEIEV